MKPSLAMLLAACATPAHWLPRPAEHPATPAELASYELTVRGPSEFTDALRERGFHVVDHAPYHNQLEVELERQLDPRTLYMATLRSDGFLVDEAYGRSPQAVAAQLALSQRVADFIRNAGLPQQRQMPGQ